MSLGALCDASRRTRPRRYTVVLRRRPVPSVETRLVNPPPIAATRPLPDGKLRWGQGKRLDHAACGSG